MAVARTLRRNRGWIAALVLLLVAGVTYAVIRSTKDSDVATTTYTTEAAANGTLSVTVSGTGNLEIADETEVWPDSAGVVESVSVKRGQKVKAGAVLFTLDGDDAAVATRKALASYRQSQSGVAQATAQVSKAQSSLEALQDRADAPSSTITAAEITAAKAEVTSAKASLTAAKANRSSSLDDYDDAVSAQNDLEVTAPLGGTVYALDVEEGDAVSASGGGSTGTTVGGTTTAASTTSGSSSTAPVVIVPDKPLLATLSVSEVDLPSLKPGQRADLEFDALPDLTITGKVTDIADEGTVEQGVVSFAVEITLDVKNKQLKPGMSVSATVVTAVARDVLLVPNAAVKSDETIGDYVQVLDDAGQPQQVIVKVGMSGDTYTEIVSGLSSGDKVVTATTDASDAEASSSQRPSGGMLMMGGGPGR